MQPKHHYQRVNTKTGYLIATRDDTEKYQDLNIREYTPDGDLYFEKRILYNIQYDYIRSQEWFRGKPIRDAIQGLDTYGHLQYEYTEGGIPAPEGWTNLYPYNHEPVKKEGADMFHSEGHAFFVSFTKAGVNANVNLCIWDHLDTYHRGEMGDLITNIKPAPKWVIEDEEKENTAALESFNPIAAAQKRLKAIRKHSKKIGVNIPYDPLFMD